MLYEITIRNSAIYLISLLGEGGARVGGGGGGGKKVKSRGLDVFPSPGAGRARRGRATAINYSLVTRASRPAAAYTGPRGSRGLIMYTRTEEITAIKGDKRATSHVVKPQLEGRCTYFLDLDFFHPVINAALLLVSKYMTLGGGGVHQNFYFSVSNEKKLQKKKIIEEKVMLCLV